MATGLTHDRITKICLPVVAAGGWAFTRNLELTLGLAVSFLFSGLMFGPDLDIQSVQTTRWGWLQWLWIPYRKFVPHRSLWSHGPLVGTLGRLLYVSLWVGLWLAAGYALGQWLGLSIGPDRQWLVWGKKWAIAHSALLWTLLVGLELGAMSHYLADHISSAVKKMRPKRRGDRRKKLAR
jgi:uncharacterized metal-binding protein